MMPLREFLVAPFPVLVDSSRRNQRESASATISARRHHPDRLLPMEIDLEKETFEFLQTEKELLNRNVLGECMGRGIANEEATKSNLRFGFSLRTLYIMALVPLLLAKLEPFGY